MMMGALCGTSSPFDFQDGCTRDLWSSIPPAALAGLIILSSLPIPIPKPISKALARLKAPFLPAITQREAEAIVASADVQPANELPLGEDDDALKPPRWGTALFGIVTALQFVGWTFFGVYHTVRGDAFVPWTYFLVAFSWAFALVRVLHRPTVTPRYDLFILFGLDLLCGVIRIGGQLYDKAAWGIPLPARADIVAEIANLVLTLIVLTLTVNQPMYTPGKDVNKDEIGTTISPEDYATLWRWITFTWVHPLIKLGNKKKLEEADIWWMSTTMRTKTTFWIFTHSNAKSLFFKCLKANSMDLIIDFVFTEVSSVLDFAEPFFLKKILDGVEGDTPIFHLFLLAFLSFSCTVLRAQSDLHHFWYSRRAATRLNTQLSAAVYQKALKIHDQSGVVGQSSSDAKDAKSTSDKKGAGDKKGDDGAKGKEGDKKASGGMDVGKIVNLLSIDVSKISNLTTMMPWIYTAPLQMGLACLFLYKILGFSAFAGFIPMILAVPITTELSKVTTRIQRSTLAAKDSRMKIVNEMFTSIKFIKWFGWEDHWISRVLAARAVEMKWLLKARNTMMAYSFIANLVPLFVSLVSFTVYVLLGNRLTIATAFTAIQLFDLMRLPLSVLPFALTQYAQVTVSLERLNNFFTSGEVPEEISSLNRTVSSDGRTSELAIECGTFRWHKGEPSSSVPTDDSNKKGKVRLPSIASTITVVSTNEHQAEDSTSTSATVVDDDVSDNDDDRLFELRDISVSFPTGHLTVVTGPTASGKTALLMALLGEMDLLPGGRRSVPKDTGSVDEYGLTNSIAYCAQTPWLQQLSIKDNITFGYPLDQERYDDVLEACALNPDLERFDDGDLTEIGAKGVSLSGGQKARVALARAVYSRAKYVLLDDPLSAVDSHTARFLYEKLLLGPLLRHRTVILVTHHVDLVLPGAHYLIRISDGHIDVQGTIKDLKAQGLLDRVLQDASQPDDKEHKPAENAPVVTGRPAKEVRKLVEDEARAEGKVKWPIYKAYLRESSYWTWFIVGVGICVAQIASLSEKYWITIWGAAYGKDGFASSLFIQPSATSVLSHLSDHWRPQNGFYAKSFSATSGYDDRFPSANEHPMFYVGVYSAIGISAALVAMICRFTLITGGLRGANRLFTKLLTRVTRGTMRWYDTTPTGRILNRFSKDIDTLDGQLAIFMNATINSMAALAANTLTVFILVPVFIPAAIVLAFAYFQLAIGYVNTARDLKRMESTSRSPIISGFSDLVEGVVTVRAFAAEQQFLESHYRRVDLMAKFWYFTWMLNRWMQFYFEILSALSVFLTTIFVLMRYRETPGFVGLVIVCAMKFGQSVYITCRGWTELELALNAVERVVEYVQEVPEEPPAIIESNRPPAYWPSSTASDSLVVVEDLEVKYAPELPSVLHGVSFSLKAQERVGLLGRTGSGKSTLAMSLLRFTDPTSGKITIDGIDITKIGVHDLRSRLTFIPQDAALFAGTIRDNLDPFNEHTDEECLDVLHRVELTRESSNINTPQEQSRAPSVLGESSTDQDSLAPSDTLTQVDETKIRITLSTQVSAGGNNFSSGQKQLLALARALLRQSTVVIMDEATSQIDMETDVKIQATIRDEFKNSLLITVAHRLRTIIDYDRLLVLDNGTIAESGTPYNLLRKQDGIFRTMCLKSGSFAELEEVARKKAEMKSNGK